MPNDLQGLGSTNKIFIREPNWIVNPKSNFDFSREMNQFVGTTLNIYNLTNSVASDFSYTYSSLSKENEYYFTNFFCDRRGKFKKFWLPYWKNPFTLQSDISLGDSVLTIDSANYNLIDQGYERIFIKLKTGSIISREVLAVVNNGTSEDIFLKTVINMNIKISEIKFFSRLLLVRFNQDEMEIKYYSDNKSDVQFSFKELPFEHDERES